jgi:hypothetical protein
MTDIEDQGDNFSLDMLLDWHRYSHRGVTDKIALQKWLDTTDGGYYWNGAWNIYFEREEDMILFQLTWGWSYARH